MLLAIGLVFAGFVLAAGLVLSAGLIAVNLLRGRRPRVVRFNTAWSPRADSPLRSSPFGGVRPHPARSAPRGEVVDIEAREVPDLPRR